MQVTCPDARCVFPNLLYGEEAAFEASTYLDTRGDKHRTVRGAWQPFFFSGRCTAVSPLHGAHGSCGHLKYPGWLVWGMPRTNLHLDEAGLQLSPFCSLVAPAAHAKCRSRYSTDTHPPGEGCEPACDDFGPA